MSSIMNSPPPAAHRQPRLWWSDEPKTDASHLLRRHHCPHRSWDRLDRPSIRSPRIATIRRGDRSARNPRVRQGPRPLFGTPHKPSEMGRSAISKGPMRAGPRPRPGSIGRLGVDRKRLANARPGSSGTISGRRASRFAASYRGLAPNRLENTRSASGRGSARPRSHLAR